MNDVPPDAHSLLKVIRQHADHTILSCDNLLLVFWRGTRSPETCALTYDLAVELARSSGTGKVASVSVIGPAAKAPSAAARAVLSRIHEDPERVVHRAALVVPDTGFIAAIVRSIALSVQTASRLGANRTFQRVDEAVTWVTDGLPTASGAPIPVRRILRALGDHPE